MKLHVFSLKILVLSYCKGYTMCVVCDKIFRL